MSAAACLICGAATRHAFSAEVLRKYRVDYDWCPACGYLRIRDPHWLAEAYSSAIGATDTGIVTRNLGLANRLEILCARLSDAPGPYLDHGSGTGLLVRLMRDRGFDFRWSDAYSDNVFARGFEYGPADQPCIAVTAFEVLEHAEHPLEFVEEALAAGRARTLVFTTELFAGEPQADWWYLSRETGQHISFFRADTLATIGRRLGLRFQTGLGLHVLTDRADLTPAMLRRTAGKVALALARLRRRPSLVMEDHERMVRTLEARGG